MAKVHPLADVQEHCYSPTVISPTQSNFKYTVRRSSVSEVHGHPPQYPHPLCTIIKILFDKTDVLSFIEVAKLNLASMQIRTVTMREDFWHRLFKRDYPINYENSKGQFGYLYDSFQVIYKERHLFINKMRMLDHYNIVRQCLIKVRSSLLSLDGNRIVVAHSSIGLVELWEINVNKTIAISQTYQLENRNYTCFYVNKERMIFPGRNGLLFVWDLKTNKLILDFAGHVNSILIELSLKGNYVLSVSSNGVIQWDINTGVVRLWFKINDAKLTSFASNGEVNGRKGLFAMGTEAGEIILYELTLANEVGDKHIQKSSELIGHKGSVNSVVLCFGYKLLSGGEDRTIRLWDLKTGTSIRIWSFHLAGIKKLMVSDGMICSLDKDGECILSELDQRNFSFKIQRRINVGFNPCDIKMLGINIIIASGNEVALLKLEKRPEQIHRRVRSVKRPSRCKNIYIYIFGVVVVTIIVLAVVLKF